MTHTENHNLESSILEFGKNQVTLFVNYSHNSFYDFHSSKNVNSQQVMYQMQVFDLKCGVV